MFNAYRVYMDNGQATSRVETLDELHILPHNGVGVTVRFSSVNYKDALSARGYPGVTKEYPHIPGIDAAGTAEDGTHRGRSVLITGFELGVSIPGGFGQKIRVPEEWIVPLPDGLSELDAMRYGTAGFTAGLSVLELERSGITPDSGPVVVTSASGGVGSMAVAILHRAGYAVTAVTRDPTARGDRLVSLGATDVLGTDKLIDWAKRPIARGHWVAGVDAAGGDILAGVLAATRPKGVVTACGLVAGSRVDTSVLPFILRGVRLIGIDSVYASSADRRVVWSRLADRWRPEGLEEIAGEISLNKDQIDATVDSLLDGTHRGRTVIRHDAAR